MTGLVANSTPPSGRGKWNKDEFQPKSFHDLLSLQSAGSFRSDPVSLACRWCRGDGRLHDCSISWSLSFKFCDLASVGEWSRSTFIISFHLVISLYLRLARGLTPVRDLAPFHNLAQIQDLAQFHDVAEIRDLAPHSSALFSFVISLHLRHIAHIYTRTSAVPLKDLVFRNKSHLKIGRSKSIQDSVVILLLRCCCECYYYFCLYNIILFIFLLFLSILFSLFFCFVFNLALIH